mmetsp:Transcript_7987/g.33611  ORF Transcript_7987/g.33611 Transcript_7987/m.33611 type:complete len:674 (+) Transcript_7987:230-2251(+)
MSESQQNAQGVPVPDAIAEENGATEDDVTVTESSDESFADDIEDVEAESEAAESEAADADAAAAAAVGTVGTVDTASMEVLLSGETDLDEAELARRKKLRTKRINVAKELLATEETYVKNLDDLMKVFYDPMHLNSRLPEDKRLLTPDDVKQIFGNLKVILGYNRMLLGDLRAHILVESNVPIQVGGVFVQMAVFLKSYTAYCNDYERALETLRRLNEKPAFDKFFKSIHNKEIIKDQNIKQFLILPVQRIPRYKMLLEEMRKATWESHPDYESLLTALQKIRQIAQFVEDAQEKFVNMNKIIDIQNKLRFSKKFSQTKLLEADRVLIEKASLKMQEQSTTNGVETIRKREVILFNDLLLITKKVVEKEKDSKNSKKTISKETYKLRKFIDLASCLGVTTALIEGQPAVRLLRSDAQIHFLFDTEEKRDKFRKSLESCHKQSMLKKQLRMASGEAVSAEALKNSTSGDKVRTPKKRRNKRKSHLHKTSSSSDHASDAVVVMNPLMQMQLSRTSKSKLAATLGDKAAERVTAGTPKMKARSNTMMSIAPPVLPGVGSPAKSPNKSRTAMLSAEPSVRKSPSMNTLADPAAARRKSDVTGESDLPPRPSGSAIVMRKPSAESTAAAKKDSDDIPAQIAARKRLEQKRSRLSRSPSVGSLGSLQSDRKKKQIPKFL